MRCSLLHFVRNTYNLIASLPYLAHREEIPDRIVLIIVPGTLLTQWSTELKILVNPKAFDIFVYGTVGQSPQAFWADQGPFLQLKQPLSRRIIIASHSVSGVKNIYRPNSHHLLSHFGLIYATAEEKDKLPWAPPTKLGGFLGLVRSTLFRQKYQVVIIDEGHEFRNVGPKHSAAFSIMALGGVHLVMTATPLQTSTKVDYIINIHYASSFFCVGYRRNGPPHPRPIFF